jgi:hypothetical protein
MERLGVGASLMSDPTHLALMRRIIEELVDFYELSPETLWTGDEAGRPVPIPAYHDLLRTIVERSGRPVVAHGLDLSPASVDAPAGERARLEAWLARIRAEQEIFGFRWYSEHLGFSVAGGWVAELPLPVPQTDEAIEAVAARLRALRRIVPLVAFENQASYYALGDPAEEPAFFAEICRRADAWMLLDLHNAYTQCLNMGMELDAYLGRMELSRVIEIHVSGGSESDPAWLPSGRSLRIDTHDQPVPEPVWGALERWLPRCPNVRGVVLERIDGTLTEADVPGFEEEFARLREVWDARRP